MRLLARPTTSPAGLTAAAGAIALLAWGMGLTEPLDRVLSDWALRHGPSADSRESPVAAVLLDDRALAALGPLPWPRSRLAQVVAKAFAAGAGSVALDMVLAGETEDDQLLASELERGPVVLAAALEATGEWLLPPASLASSARLAHAEAELGADGVVRELSSTKQSRGVSLPALALAAARLNRPDLAVAPGAILQPDFSLRPWQIPSVGALELLAAEPNEILRHRIVFVGVSATASTDQFVVPVRDAPVPGVLVHASAAVSILTDRLLKPIPPAFAILLCLGLAALAQSLRTRAGRVRLPPMLAVLAALPAAAVALEWTTRWQTPVTAFWVAFGLSALLREVVESETARRETGELLAELVRQTADAEAREPAGETAPGGAAGRLLLARELQARLAADRDLRAALLDSLEDGVVRWNASGDLALANAAALRLWGSEPSLDELRSQLAADEESDRPIIERGNHHLQLLLRELEDGHLGVLRDVTAERDLERRRREMQRILSHELKTPLSSLVGFASMLRRYDLSPDEQHRIGRLLGDESQRLLDMVGAFLDLERLGSGVFEARREPVDLDALVHERCDLLTGAASQREQAISIASPGSAEVPGDRTLLARLVDNLVGNALKYAPERTTVEVVLSTSDDEIELAVRDSGPGIPAEDQERIFERFVRLPGSGSRGSGLGLTLVREIASWHRGCVTLESTPGSGSTFTVRLPRRAPMETT